MEQKELEQKIQTLIANQLNLAKEKVTMDALIVEDLALTHWTLLKCL